MKPDCIIDIQHISGGSESDKYIKNMLSVDYCGVF